MWNKYSAKQVNNITLCKDNNTDLRFSFYIFIRTGASQMQKRLKFIILHWSILKPIKLVPLRPPFRDRCIYFFSAITELCISIQLHWNISGMWNIKCPLIPTASQDPLSQKESCQAQITFHITVIIINAKASTKAWFHKRSKNCICPSVRKNFPPSLR